MPSQTSTVYANAMIPSPKYIDDRCVRRDKEKYKHLKLLTADSVVSFGGMVGVSVPRLAKLYSVRLPWTPARHRYLGEWLYLLI